MALSFETRWLALTLAMTAGTVLADPITHSAPLNFIDAYLVNPLGIGAPIGRTGYYTGDTREVIGIEGVSPTIGTTVTASHGATTIDLPFAGTPAFPGQYLGGAIHFDPTTSFTGSWDIAITNPASANSPVHVASPSLGVTTPSAPVSGVSLTGNLLAPTVSWSIPAGSTANSEGVFVYQITPGVGATSIFSSARLAPTTTSYALPTGLLTAGDVYSIAVQSNIRDASAAANLEVRASEFTANFVATSHSSLVPVYLPTVSASPSAVGGPVYDFDVAVTRDAPIVIDPVVATGYVYRTGANDPRFASVELPDIGNGGPYSLYLWNGVAFVFDTLVAAGTPFSFGPDGVSQFEILGIDPQAGIDAYDVTAFMTQLTFTGTGEFTGTMTPVLLAGAVPEPSDIALLGLGFAILAAARRRAGPSRARASLG